MALAGFIVTACASVKPVEFKKFGDTSKYKYAVVGETQSLSSAIGNTSIDSKGNTTFSSISKSINPRDVISGILMKKGVVVLDSVDDNHKAETLLVQYGQGYT